MRLTRRNLLRGLAGGGAAAAAGPAEARKRKVAGPDSVGMLYDSTRCIGCRACVAKCREANDLPPSRVHLGGGVYDAPLDLDGRTKTVIRLVLDGDRGAFVKSQCMHCVDPACVSVCMIGALQKNTATGLVSYQKDVCVGCRYCQVACPFNVPKFNWDVAFPQIVKCELCRHRADPKATGIKAVANPACCQACPREAVIFGKRLALLAEAKRRIAEAPDRYQPRVYGETDAGGTQVLYLAASGFEFEDLGLPELGPRPVPERAEVLQHAIYYGMIAPVALFGAALVTMRRHRAQLREEGD
jgi:Fe-S-cluster-containing dehydrogenase component